MTQGCRRPRGAWLLALSALCFLDARGRLGLNFAGLSTSRKQQQRLLVTRASETAQEMPSLQRRLMLASVAAPLFTKGLELPAAAEAGTVFVAGATGNTGARVVKELQSKGYSVVAGARNVEKAAKIFGSSGPRVEPFNVETLDVEAMAKALQGSQLLICATGFVPGNPFDMGKAAQAVDKEGTIKLVDAAKKAGVQKFVLISSILTNGRAIGQESNPGFVITNAFGGVLDQKLVAENYLKASGLDYTIVRPGGLKDSPPQAGAIITKEDVLLSGEVSRDLVAQVAVDALVKPGASKATVELIEEGTCLSNAQKCEDLPKGAATSDTWFKF